MGNFSQRDWAAEELEALIKREAAKLPNLGMTEVGSMDGGGDVFFTTSVLGMTAISHVIEEQALSMGQAVRFYSSFQRFSRVKPQEMRYRQIVAAHIPVYIFGIPDAPLWKDPYLTPITLTASADPTRPSLTQNWFVVLDNPQFVSMALVCQELPQNERPAHALDKLVYRNFEGFWTYDKTVIAQVVSILDKYIKERTI